MPTHQILATEEMVGAGHGTKADTLNRFINLITAEGDILVGTAAATAKAIAKGAAGTLLGMNDADTELAYKTLKVTDAGIMTNAGQIAFSAFVASAIPNATGDATDYTVIFETEVFDQGSNYAVATGIFTAPAAGRYAFSAGVYINGVTIMTTYDLRLVTSNRIWQLAYVARPAGSQDVASSGMAIVDMDASDTAYVNIKCSGEGAKTDNVYGAATNPLTYFCGALVC